MTQFKYICWRKNCIVFSW